MDTERLNLPSASSFALDFACAGRQNLLRQMREQGAALQEEDSEMVECAARGTRIHEARRTGSTFALSGDELESYTKACGFERALVAQWMTDRGISVVSDPVQEERLWLRSNSLAPLLSGALDLIYLAGQHALIPDFKTGSAYWVGAANSSWQLRIYALLAWKEWPQLKYIRVAFVKPEAFGGKLDWADFDENSLRQVEQAVLHAIWKSEQPDALLNAGRHCRFCQARSVCTEAARYSMLPILATGAGVDTSKERIEQLVSLMPIESAVSLWKKAKIIEVILAAVEARLKALPDEALTPLGLARKEGRKLETVRDIIGAFNALRALGHTTEQILACMKLGKGDVVAMFQSASGDSKAAAEKAYEAVLGEFIERSRAKPSLVDV